MEITPPCILIIDDDPDVRSLLHSMLSREGFPVTMAADGPSALKLIEQGGIDLLITDIGLPGPMNGIETVRQARALNPHLRSLFISGQGFASWDDPDNDDFVSKPFHDRELIGCIWELFSRRFPHSSPSSI